MSHRIRFEHEVLSSGQHVVKSPDIKGFFIVADTGVDAERQAVEMLALIQNEGLIPSGNITAIEYDVETT